MSFSNSYEDVMRADAYAQLEFSGTYYLAYRDLPDIIANHTKGSDALDFGCGTGRSTRFLKKLGFQTVGVDISQNMIDKAKTTDVTGEYQLVKNEQFKQFSDGQFDLVISIFTFDNIPTREKKARNLLEIARVLKTGGTFVNLVSSPEIYVNEWASFSTKDFPENRHKKSGDVVRIVITDIEDKRSVEDVVFHPEDHVDLFMESGFSVTKVYKPLATGNENYSWVNETEIAPWTIYVLKKN